MAVGIMAPPVEPITKVFDGDFSTEGAMDDGGRSPESGTKGNHQERNETGKSEIKSGF